MASNTFQTNFEKAVTLYGTVASNIRGLADSGNISRQVIEFSNEYSSLQNVNPQMLQNIKTVAEKYQQLDLETRKYVGQTKTFAQDNIRVAQNVLKGEQYSKPESILKYFKKTAERLDKAFEVVLDKYCKVYTEIINITSEAKREGKKAQQLSLEADIKKLCRTPVFGVVAGPVIRAAEFAHDADHPVAKGIVGFIGFVTGILESAISTALLGIPAIAASEEQKKLEHLQMMYKSIVSFMEKFAELVKEHKNLLSTISTLVSTLPEEYKDFQKSFQETKTLDTDDIHLFKTRCEDIVEACGKYLM